MESKIKTYVLTLSMFFPKTHARSGQPTYFLKKLRQSKLHTIRANYELWSKRFAEIANGRACLSVRRWRGQPYKSEQIELVRLTAADGIGLQRLDFDGVLDKFTVDGRKVGDVGFLAANDGLLLEDWREWFKGYDITKPLAVIQFTKFRY